MWCGLLSKALDVCPSCCPTNIKAIIKLHPDFLQHIWRNHVYSLGDTFLQFIDVLGQGMDVNFIFDISPEEKVTKQLGLVILGAICKTLGRVVQRGQSICLVGWYWEMCEHWQTSVAWKQSGNKNSLISATVDTNLVKIFTKLLIQWIFETKEGFCAHPVLKT